jgi:diguanylate cyclase (GGDEF)-like protein
LRALAIAALAVALLIAAPWVGWWTLIPLVLTGAMFSVIDRGLACSRRPEYRMFAGWALSEVAIAVSVALTGGPRSPGVAWLALPVVTLAARFSSRGVLVGLGLSAAMLLGCTLGVHPHYAITHPQVFVFPLALLVGTAVLSLALMQSDRQHRSASVIDPLTSMLNRTALRARVAELAHQARVIHQPIAVVVADVDGFKQINDSHGHTVGDAVLRDLAYRLRKQLRAFDLAYRLGGEEFVILLPGADAEQAESVAEQLRAAVAHELIMGLEVTISAGVSASAPGSFDYDAIFRAADTALYEAKRAGRNRVSAAAPPVEPHPVRAEARLA